MAFVRYKVVNGRKYYQLVRNYREGGKHKQQMLCHLGLHESLEAAIESQRQKVASVEGVASELREEAERKKAELLNDFAEQLAGELPSFPEVYARMLELEEERVSIEKQWGQQAISPTNGWSPMWEWYDKWELVERAYDYYETLASAKYAEIGIRAERSTLNKLLRLWSVSKLGSKFLDF